MGFAKSIVKPCLRVIVKVLFRTRIHGLFPSTLPDKLIIAANHVSFLDGLILGLLLPADPIFVVHTWVANNFWFKLGLSLVDYVAVDPTSPMAMKSLAREIDRGRPIVIFPEGQITRTGSMMKIYEGPAFLAAKTGAQILPVHLDGPTRSYFSRLSSAHPKKLFPQIDVSFLPLCSIQMPDLSKAKERRKASGDQLRHIMQEADFLSARPKTLWDALIDAAQLLGYHSNVIEDIVIFKNSAGKEESGIQTQSYSQMIKKSSVIARWIQSRNEGNRRVGLLLPNGSGTLSAIFGTSALGITPCMLNYTAGPAALASALKASEATHIVSSKVFVEKAKLSKTVEELQKNGVIFDWVDDLKEGIPLNLKLHALLDSLLPKRLLSQKDPQQEAVVLFTSGSEGTPKGVVLSHRALMANASQIRSVMDIGSEDKFLCALPMFHSFGLTAGSLLPIISGSKLFIYPSPLHYRVIPEIAYGQSCTVLFGTNTFLAQYGKFAHPYDFCKVRRVVAGAEKLQDATRELWNDKFGLRIFEGYGATETAPVLSVNTPMNFKRGSVGQLLPGVEFKLIPVPGVEAGGLLHVRGPNLMNGYLKAETPGLLIAPECESGVGWHNLGDIVRVDSEGFLFIQGRLKRFAKIAGEMVSLETPEKLAQTASASFAHACISRFDAQKGEALVLFTTDANLTREQLISAAKQIGAPELAVPRDLRLLSAIPVLGTGKTDYVALNQLCSTLEPQTHA